MSPKVLIIDDSESICAVLKQMLTQMGLESVDTCNDGLDALSKIKAEPEVYDAVFVDLNLPGIDGLELIYQLDKMNYMGGVVIISGLEQKVVELAETVVKTTKLKFLGTAIKPFSSTLMAFLVKRLEYIRHRIYPQVDYIKRRELFQALKENTLVPYYQPKVSGDFEKVIGVELLARVDIYGRGRVSPEQVIPVALKYGLFNDFFEKLLHQSLTEFLEFMEQSHALMHLSINILPDQLKNDRLFYQLDNALNNTGFPKQHLMLEITEQQALNSSIQLKNLNRLRISGFEISLDDFGSGFTHLAQIRQLPLSEVKLDSKMVVGISEDPVMEVICHATKEITESLGIPLIAEGIDNQDDLNVLEKLGVDGYQGYAICRPKPMDEFALWYQKWQELRQESSAF
jgi:EAL domain-containing protein (putative c-di-GMP-specific phosphodiesterase class I)/DNA-binding NarL/FixJ family response regulator